jgi:hypothetical protein
MIIIKGRSVTLVVMVASKDLAVNNNSHTVKLRMAASRNLPMKVANRNPPMAVKKPPPAMVNRDGRSTVPASKGMEAAVRSTVVVLKALELAVKNTEVVVKSTAQAALQGIRLGMVSSPGTASSPLTESSKVTVVALAAGARKCLVDLAMTTITNMEGKEDSSSRVMETRVTVAVTKVMATKVMAIKVVMTGRL